MRRKRTLLDTDADVVLATLWLGITRALLRNGVTLVTDRGDVVVDVVIHDET